ncbi:glycine--tRNA ligase subunit beta [Advenella mimigardefordensis]|uniref:Glycine--tRNA ligase beta subunit n=1 Tax=Advenella mimigardefordensis (strain DSM 17166 / LMG 22922 / DPN7) TaxID=1247726 RepID=W0PH43_ADVMD|nr:glycine--tRNA ligase subunit beta [Advenella mimigardefordensis]AHG64730.1 glycine--tRNA ligase beta subunit [Advenella mimigardefordensis DPN7]
MNLPLLVELFTEELPPRALQKLGQAFADSLTQALAKQHLLGPDNVTHCYATPRRLAAQLSSVLAVAADQPFSEKLMPVKVGLDAQGQATPALQKKLAAKNLSHLKPADLARESDGKQEYLVAHGTAAGAQLQNVLQAAIETALADLPIPKVMRYQLADGQTSVRFVRPVHGLVVLHGSTVLPVTILGIDAGNTTHGHRFMSAGPITLAHANDYAATLADKGRVIASFEARRDAIRQQLDESARALGASLGDQAEVAPLLDEVTALVEHPTVYVGQFDEKFLAVPQECLILTMRLNQKYFPLFDPASGKLIHQFLIVSNMHVADPANIIQGNERVIRPRLADAEFFFETDRKQPLASRVAQLDNIVYHNKLGSQHERIERLRRISSRLAEDLNANVALADRAAQLAKADLTSNMVGEFPELQGIMGGYYAQADGEPAEVVQALNDQYRTRFDSPVTNNNLIAAILFIAERIETLVGIWGIGLQPSGERDPFGLRRAALGIISAVEQLAAGGYLSGTPAAPARFNLTELLTFAMGTFSPGTLHSDTADEVQTYIYERYRNQLSGDYAKSVVDAVIAVRPALQEVAARIKAVTAFAQLPEAESLAAANKRIGNLLKKTEGDLPAIDPSLFAEPAEKALYDALHGIEATARADAAQGQFEKSLAAVAQTRSAVDDFFTHVMVMADDPAVRNNRLALLSQLHATMNLVADISRLAQ